jgi:hypothetical protein
MSIFPEARNVSPGDREYDFLHGVWVKQQRPAQFDWQGKEGGVIVYVYDRGDIRPVFHIHAEAGPTLLDETAPGGPLTFGFEPLMQCRGQLRYTAPSHNRRGRMVKVPLPMQRSNL